MTLHSASSWVNKAVLTIHNNVKRIDTIYREPSSAVNVSNGDLEFTGRLFVYTPFDISTKDQSELLEHYNTLTSARLIFRGPIYAESISENPAAFISHDSRDRDSIARPIATRLRGMGHDVWYDEFSLQPGDSLRGSIENGLKNCRKCIVVLTPNFLPKGGWTKREYDYI